MKTNSYTSAMVHLTVTSELRERLLESVAAPRPRRRSAAMPLALAACLLLVLSAAFLPRLLQKEPNTLVDNPMHKVESVAELQKSAPFPLLAPGFMPEGYAVESTYLIAGDIAQIKYTGSGGGITYRVAAGTGDVSGDYTQYAQTATEPVGENSVTLKGSGGMVSLCTWADSDYTYALSFEAPVSPETARAIVESVCPVV